MNLYRITSNWNEDNVTGNTQPTYASQPTTNSLVPNNIRWITWDVANDIQEFVNGTKKNYGWMIIVDNILDLNDISETMFYSEEYENYNYWPKLEINIK